jgi:glycosyltransferase involved in cell wall biosynthesis
MDAYWTMEIIFTLHDDFDANAGGMGVTAGLAEVYAERGHGVDYLTFDDLPGVLSFRTKFLLFPSFVALRLSRFRGDVIDASCGDTWIWARMPWHAWRTERPLLVTRSHGLLHIADRARRAEAERGGMHLSWKYPLYWGGYRLREVAASYRSADLCLLLNEEERAFAIEEFGIPEDRARIVDNGLAQDLIGRTPEPADPPGALGIAHVGSYLELKGVRYTAAALGSVLERHPGAHVSFLGTGCPPAQVLEDYDEALHPRIRVVPHYRREDLPQLLRGHSLTVSATLQDAFHLGTLEAMACGLAPVVADTAGPLRYVRDGDNGVVVPRADSAALEQALEGLLADPERVGRLRAKAHRTAQRYGWDRIADETLALYAEAIERRR